MLAGERRKRLECEHRRSGGRLVRCGGMQSNRAAVLGNSNGDASIDFDDIDCIVPALISQASWASCGTTYGAFEYVCANDIDGDGRVTFDDIGGFVSCLVAGVCP